MIQTIDLKQFCGRRYQVPFTIDGWDYATDGIICVRVPSTEPVPFLDFIPPSAHQLGWDKDLGKTWYFLPDLNTLPAGCESHPLCSECDGEGFTPAYRSCPDCNGWGEVSFIVGRHEYTPDCQECDGEGRLVDYSSPKVECPECCEGRPTLSLWGCAFAAKYLKKIAALPKVTACISDWDTVFDKTDGKTEKSKSPLLHFQFDGGEGFLMPLQSSK